MASNFHSQNSIERKWGIQLSPNHYFRQSIDRPKKDNAFVRSRNGLNGSAYIFRNFNIKKAPRLSFTAMMGVNVYPLLDVLVGYNKDFPPENAIIEIDQIILQDREAIYPDAWFQFNYEIFNNTQINSAIGL